MTNTTPPRALALVGMPGAGKSLCAKHLEACGFFQYRFGSIVVNEVLRRGLPLTPENERVVREELRANDGMDVMARRALPLQRPTAAGERVQARHGAGVRAGHPANRARRAPSR